MKTKKKLATHPVIESLLKIMKDEDIKQETLAEYAGISASQMSKVLNGTVQLSLWQLSNIATNLNWKIIDIFTYPDFYKKDEKGEKTLRISVELEVTETEFKELGLKNKIKKILER